MTTWLVFRRVRDKWGDAWYDLPFQVEAAGLRDLRKMLRARGMTDVAVCRASGAREWYQGSPDTTAQVRCERKQAAGTPEHLYLHERFGDSNKDSDEVSDEVLLERLEQIG